MRKIIFILLTLLLITGYTSYLYFYQPKIENPYVKEYTHGNSIQGMVNKDKFSSINTDFEIGASEEGYAVFKNPDKAFGTFIELYEKELNYVKKDNWILLPICYSNLNKYSMYCMNSYSKAIEEDEKFADRIKFIMEFIDIYENSYIQ